MEKHYDVWAGHILPLCSAPTRVILAATCRDLNGAVACTGAALYGQGRPLLSELTLDTARLYGLVYLKKVVARTGVDVCALALVERFAGDRSNDAAALLEFLRPLLGGSLGRSIWLHMLANECEDEEEDNLDRVHDGAAYLAQCPTLVYSI